MRRNNYPDMSNGSIGRYFRYLSSRKRVYLTFNKQLLIAELAGFVAGIIVAEVAASLTKADATVSVYSAIADYAGSVLAFVAIYYRDTANAYMDDTRRTRVRKVLKSLSGLWLPIIVADVAFLIVRPYFQYLLMVNDIGPGLAGGIAHFAAFGVFNIVAIFSRSIYEYARGIK